MSGRITFNPTTKTLTKSCSSWWGRRNPGLSALAVSFFLLGFAVAPCRAGVTIFPTRDLFDAAVPGLPIEDFDDLSFPVNTFGVDVVGDVVDSTTNATPIGPGDILPGISFTTTDLAHTPNSLTVLNPFVGFFPTTNVLGPNWTPETGADQLVMDFSPSVDAVGFDVWGLLNGPGSVAATFFNGAAELGSTTVVATDTPASFAGGVANDADVITRVVLDMQIDVQGGNAMGEFVDDVAFGVVPEPSSLSLLPIVLFCLLSRRKQTER